MTSNRSNDGVAPLPTDVPAYLVETVENLLRYLSLSQQSEIIFPSSLFASERAFVRRRAKQLGFHAVTTTKENVEPRERSICVYKKNPNEKPPCKYHAIIVQDVLNEVFASMEKYPITTYEFRIFTSSKDHDEFLSQDGEVRTNRDLVELDFNFSVPSSQVMKLAKINPGMQEYRKSLPIHDYKELIVNYLSDNKVLIVHGGVASGKSTQVPQYLMEKCFEAGVGYKIFLCEPHRITTVAVAERIAHERKEEIGQSVGYQIPLETKKSATSIIICVTPDVLLKMLISKEQVFQGKVVVILDEFEESDYVTEFLLIGLKDLFKVNPFLRLIIMTNANDVTPLFTYFTCPKTDSDTSIKTATISMPSNLIPIQEYFLEDILMRTDFLNQCRIKDAADIPGFQTSPTELPRSNKLDMNTGEVIDSAMEKVWNVGDDNTFTFLLNMVKKNIISVNHQLKRTGVTLLMAACTHGKLKYILQLLKSGADPSIRCYGGFTATDFASKKKYSSIVDVLNYYLMCNNEKVISDREYIKLAATNNYNEHTNRLITYYENFYPEHGIDMELLYTTVLYIHAFRSPGAIVVFLPSFFDILSFRDLLFERESELLSSGGEFTLRFLYSNMQTSEQKLIFQVPPPNCRKIILSTNVGAVGLTINDLVYVIDTGKIEQKMYIGPDGKLTFLTGWITSAQAVQRATKVGRLQPGCCYRLYSQLITLAEKNPIANIYTCSPKILCLYTKQMVSNEISVSNYLSRALTVPEVSSLKQSVDILKSIDAFDIRRNYEYLTELGKIMLQLPLEPQYAKMVLYAVALKCVDPILSVVAFSKHKSIFKLEDKFKMKSHIALKEWKKISSKYFSDHLILINLFLGRQNAGVEKRDKEYCEEFCISQATFELVNTTRSNIVGHLRAMGIVKSRGVNDMRDLNSNSKEWVFVKAALVGGLYPNLIFVDRAQNMLRCNSSRKEMLLHPLSTLSDYSLSSLSQTVMLTQDDVVKNLPTDWLIYDEIHSSYSTDVSTTSMCTAVTPVTLALFAGSYKICTALKNRKSVLLLQNNDSECEDSDSGNDDSLRNMHTFMIDSNLELEMDGDSAKAILYLRIKWFSYFLRCLRSPSKPLSVEEKQILETIASVLKYEEKCLFPATDPDFIGHKPASYTIDLFQQPNTTFFKGLIIMTPYYSAMWYMSTLKKIIIIFSSDHINIAVHTNTLPDTSAVNSIPPHPGFTTENSRYFLIKSCKYNTLAASVLNGCWKFEPTTEAKLKCAFNTGAEVKLVFQFSGSNSFQGVALLLSDQYANVSTNNSNFLPIQWLKEGRLLMSTVGEYIDADTLLKLSTSVDGTEMDCSLAGLLMSIFFSEVAFQ